MMVKFSTDDPEKFCSILIKEFPDIADLKMTDSEVEFEINRENIPEINSLMVGQDITISGIEQKRKLEDYFIKMIQNEE